MTTQITSPQRSRSRALAPRPAGKYLVLMFMVVSLCYFLTPLIWLLISSTKSNADLFSTFGFWFSSRFNLFQNISDLFARDNGAFLIWMMNTAVYATSAAVGSALISALAMPLLYIALRGATCCLASYLLRSLCPGPCLLCRCFSCSPRAA